MSGDARVAVADAAGGGADAGADADTGPLLISNLVVADNPTSEISCLVSFTTNRPTRATVEFGATTDYSFRVRGSDELSSAHTVAVIGMYAESEYHLRATASDADAETAVSEDRTYVTGTLPSWVWTGTIGANVGAQVEPGWTLTNGGTGPPTAVMYDMSGRPVWYYAFDTADDAPAGIVASFDAVTRHVIVGPGTLQLDALEVDLAGNITWVGPRGSPGAIQHHEFGKLPDDTYVTLRRKDVGEISGDVILIYDLAKAIAWSWDAFDHLTPPGEVTSRWLHANAVTVDKAGDAVYLSARALDTIFKINYTTGDVVWELGVDGDFTLSPAVTDGWFDAQHDPEIQPGGNVLVYDNGATREATRVVEYALDEGEMTATLVWEFPGDASGLDSWYTDSWYTPIWGGVQRLANGNTLIAAGSRDDTPSSRVFEVSAGRTVVWEMSFVASGDNALGIYRATRIPELVERL